MHILLIDDHELFRSGLSAALQTLDDNITISEADCIASAQSAIKAKHGSLDLILLDQKLPDGKGIDFLAYLQQHYPLIPVAILSAIENPKLMRRSLTSGALGYIPKSTSTSIIVRAIQLMLSGGTYIPAKMLSSLSSSEMIKAKQVEITHGQLTPRQLEVQKLICQGLANKEIAWQLNITEGTVKIHASVILKAKGFHSRKQLTASGNH